MSGQTVRDGDGNVYVVEKRASDSSRVRDLETGEQRYLPNADLEAIDGASPLLVAARTLPNPDEPGLSVAPGERAVGLLVELDRTGPIDVRTMLERYDFCESDLHGVIGELQAAGLIQEVSVTGMRGYDLTAEGNRVLEMARTDE